MKDLMTGRLRRADRDTASPARAGAGPVRRSAWRAGALAAIVLAGAAVAAPSALAATSASSAQQATTASQSSAVSARPASPQATPGYTIRFRLTNATNEELQRTAYDLLKPRLRWQPIPQATVPFLGIADFTVLGTSQVEAQVKYRIGDSGYSVEIYATDRAEADPPDTRSASCDILTTANGSVAKNAPYKCETNRSGTSNMNASFVVEPTAATTQTLTPSSGLSAAGGLSELEAVQSLCNPDSPAFVSCDVASSSDVKNVSVVAGTERIVSPILANCTASNADKTVATTDTVTETNTIGVTGDVTKKLSETVTPKLALTFQHQWTQTLTTTDTVKVTAQPGEFVYLTEAPWMQQVTGTWTLKAGNQTILATDLTLLRPSQGVNTNVVIAHTSPVPDGFCTGQPKSFFQFQNPPVDPAPGGAYTIRPAKANGRSIGVASGLHTPTAALYLTAANDADRSQRWVFYPVLGYPDYYQIHSANTPSMCLDLNGQDLQGIQQYPCKADTDSTIGNQLWQVVYDPTTNSFEMVSKAVTSPDIPSRTLALASSSFNIGDQVIGLANPPANVSSWLFYNIG